MRSIGDEPPAPLLPVLTTDEPTVEGLHKLFERGQPSLGLFSDEGGTFLGGHAMASENRLRTMAALSSIWDASRSGAFERAMARAFFRAAASRCI